MDRRELLAQLPRRQGTGRVTTVRPVMLFPTGSSSSSSSSVAPVAPPVPPLVVEDVVMRDEDDNPVSAASSTTANRQKKQHIVAGQRKKKKTAVVDANNVGRCGSVGDISLLARFFLHCPSLSPPLSLSLSLSLLCMCVCVCGWIQTYWCPHQVLCAEEH